MGSLDRVVREEAVALAVRPRVGWIAGAATGIAVGAAVTYTLMHDFESAAVPLGLLAFVCTGLGTYRAARASTWGRAVGWVLATNVLPPTLVFLPTLIGVLFSLPAGLIAAAIVMPIALMARRWAREERAGDERDRILGASLNALVALAIFAFEASQGPYLHGSAGLLPALVAALASFALAGVAFARDAKRMWIAWRVRREGWWIVRVAESDRFAVERTIDLGAGPMRVAPTIERLGELTVAPVRTAIGLAAAALASSAVIVWLAAAF